MTLHKKYRCTCPVSTSSFTVQRAVQEHRVLGGGGGGYNEVTQQRESLHNPTYLGLICLVKCAYVGGWRKQSYFV